MTPAGNGVEAGAVPVELAAAIGLLLFPVFVFVLTIAPVVERRIVAGRAAAEAARAFVVADDASAGREAAHSLVEQIDANHPFTLTLSLNGTLDRGSVVTARVDVAMPLLVFPGVETVTLGTYSATHREEVDLFRSYSP